MATTGLRQGREGSVSGDFYNYDGFVRGVRGEFTAKLRDNKPGLNLDCFGARNC
jgi:hypothetical protein